MSAERAPGDMPCPVTEGAHNVLAEVVELTTGPHWENRCTLCHEVWWTPRQFDGDGCDIPGCDHKRSNRGYDMRPTDG